MINLLLVEDKKEIIHEYKVRRVFLWGTGISATFSVGVVLMLVIFGVLDIKVGTWDGGLGRFEDSQITAESQAKLAMIESVAKNLRADEKVTFSEKIEQVLSFRPSGVKINRLNISTDSNRVVRMDLIGLASSRQDAVLYMERVRDSGYFSKIDFPISNLIKDTGSDFKLSFDVTPNK